MNLATDIRENLGALPKSLHNTYDELFMRIKNQPQNERAATLAGLKWAMCAPIKLKKEQWVQFTSRVKLVDTADRLLELCRNLIIWDRDWGFVGFAHLSVIEYLEKAQFSMEDAHLMAAECCLSALNDCDGLISRADCDQNRFTFYSAIHWAYHTEQCAKALEITASPERQRLSRQLQQFLGTPGKPGSAYRNCDECLKVLHGQ